MKFPCPDCESNDIKVLKKEAPNEAGQYMCLNCGRESSYKTGKAISPLEMMQQMKKQLGQ
jgi:transposase-like protein